MKVFHGDIKPEDFSLALIGEFNQENIRAQQVGHGDEIVVQIATREMRRSGGKTAVTVTLEKAEDGVIVQVGKQSWFGVAASLGYTALAAIRNPFNLLGRLDDVAQDIESLQLSERVWEIVENVAYTAGASFELTERLRRLVCQYCRTANPLGSSSCLACGAPLGDAQPSTCKYCGFVVSSDDKLCPNCEKPL
jgi:hypothetical protein